MPTDSSPGWTAIGGFQRGARLLAAQESKVNGVADLLLKRACNDLAIERHLAGEGPILTVFNAHVGD